MPKKLSFSSSPSLIASIFISFALGLAQTTFSKPSSSSDSAILVDGSGTYHREISTENRLAQQFFDQGLRSRGASTSQSRRPPTLRLQNTIQIIP